jgi:O-antigen ligase
VEQPRELLGSSGRQFVWRAALSTAAQRPGAGYGFGTEDRAFVDRYANFAGGVPENSYIGIFLQLGVAGLVSFALLLATIVASGFGALPRSGAAAACAGVVTAGLVAAVVQSYIYSVGNVATVTFWVAAFLLAAIGAAARRAVPAGPR